MVGLVLVILASAMKRMALYESAYGYTHLRVYTHVFMVALAGVLVWRAVTLWWRPERFAIGAFVGALGFLAALNVLNPDAFIARGNLARVRGGSALDESYMVSLVRGRRAELAASMARSPRARSRRTSRHALPVHRADAEGLASQFLAPHAPRRPAAGWPSRCRCPLE